VAIEPLFCPLHGDYLPEEGASACPSCREDPVASSASLRQVRVVREDELASGVEADGGMSELTPMADEFPCPVCGTVTPVEEFRVESVGEVWTGNAAVWAEEGVCPDCYREVLEPQIREWSDAEWLVHHYEGWKATVDTVHNLFVYEESPHESWLPEESRHRVLDVEKTLSARREHMTRCQMTMRDLQGRYGANLTPPPFQMTLASGSDAISARAVAELRGMRDRDLEAEMQRRHESVVARAPVTDTGEYGGVPEVTEKGSPAAVEPPPPSGPEAWVVPVAAVAFMAALVAGVLFLLSMRG
jgi:hypothetical protein